MTEREATERAVPPPATSTTRSPAPPATASQVVEALRAAIGARDEGPGDSDGAGYGGDVGKAAAGAGSGLGAGSNTGSGGAGARHGAPRVRVQASLASLTTFHVGGPADYLVEAHDADQLVAIARVAREHGLPLTVLGGGSNVLIADRGIRGVVVLARDRAVAQIDAHHIRAGAGLTINGLVRWTIGRGLAGLEAWAGTPGTVGGAIHGNAHFQGRLVSELVREVRVLMPDGSVRNIPAANMGFGYDTSRLQGSGEVALSAVFRVGPGDPDALRRTARESLAFRKRTQPLDVPSAGCIFQNPDPARDRVPDGIPPSAGALIDRAGLKGTTIGDARVSPTHGNFIVHDGDATAADIRALMARCQDAVATRFGVQLREEIVYLGEF